MSLDKDLENLSEQLKRNDSLMTEKQKYQDMVLKDKMQTLQQSLVTPEVVTFPTTLLNGQSRIVLHDKKIAEYLKAYFESQYGQPVTVEVDSFATALVTYPTPNANQT